ncbi:MAG TPA: CpsB/CapC family capsule biosynthesis tyrosine phosphatase, partial [Pirellulaceae bacterium]|nr:CpsB/CapC family capsule biosynthesis tyrosine phosphatase [Pirellulaceae bacterium]
MHVAEPFIDIHCHLLPGLDDGARSWDEALEMAKIAFENGISTIIATPHQGGTFAHIRAERICAQIDEFRAQLALAGIPLHILPGADVRLGPDLLRDIARGETLTLGNHRRHLLLDLPHERYVPFHDLLADMQSAGLAIVLSHPERNQGLLKRRELVMQLVDHGCLMQVTSGSLLGTFGPQCQDLAVWMLGQGLAHFVVPTPTACTRGGRCCVAL